MRTAPLVIIAVVLLLIGCEERRQDIVVVSRTLKKEKVVNTAVPDEFSSLAPASGGTNYWVEGSVRNDGTEDISNAQILFKCTEGVDTRLLIASVQVIPAGKTVKFKTKLFSSKYTVKLLDEDPEFEY